MVSPKSQNPQRGLCWRLAGAGCVSIGLHAFAFMAMPASVQQPALHHDLLSVRLVSMPAAEAVAVEVLKDSMQPPSTATVRAARAAKARKAAPPVQQSSPSPRVEETVDDAADSTAPASLQARVAQALFYPPEAVARGLEGEVVVAVEVDASGRIVDASVVAGSGHALLDEAALRAVQRVGRLPGAARRFLLPVRFRLD